MKKLKWLIITLAIAAAAFTGYKFYRSASAKDEVLERKAEPLLAVYDRTGNINAAFVQQCRHITIRWNNSGPSDFLEQLQPLLANNAALLLTIETWPPAKKNVLPLITNGAYDEKILSLASVLGKLQQPVMIRFNPDMEVYVNRYPWLMQGPDQYTKAFRHFSETIKKKAPAVKIVWAPAGYPGTEEYWPGAKWVDLVSVTLKGKSEGMTDNYPEEKTMWQLIFRKLHRVRFFDKPVLAIGSEKLTKEDFKQADFDSAAGYIRRNSAIEYIDLNTADRESDSSVLRKNPSLQVGVFDPFGKMVDSTALTTEHLFVNLRVLKTGVFKRRFDSVLLRNRDIIVTMEPWRDTQIDKDPYLLANILAGKYDPVLEEMCRVINGCPKKVYLRWLHEMEIPITRYPWQSQDPIQYIKAYRYFVNYVRNKNPGTVFFVWGPAGDRGSMEFWPGSDVVDFVSIAIYGLPDKNITDHNKQESFNTIFKRKYRRVALAHKPLFITEFGVKGPLSYKKEWLEGAAGTIESNKEIVGISYFNDADNPKAWGNIEAPDWSIPPFIFRGFQQQLKTSFQQ